MKPYTSRINYNIYYIEYIIVHIIYVYRHEFILFIYIYIYIYIYIITYTSSCNNYSEFTVIAYNSNINFVLIILFGR